MLRWIFLIVFMLTIAVGGGVGSVEYALKYMDDFSPITLGFWHAYPESGTRYADPYARARAAKFNRLALGRAEGLSFYLWRDDEGKPLKGTCSYTLTGSLPAAQFFTLYRIGHDLLPQRTQKGRPDILTSYDMVQNRHGDYLISISPQARGGNWLASEGEETYGLMLTLYDSSLSVTTGLSHPTMPLLTREAAC